MLKAALERRGPKAIRWPRGNAEAVENLPVAQWPEIAWGSWEILKEGSDAYVLALGPTLAYALEATRTLPNVGVINARFVKPLDEQMLVDIARHVSALVTVEDHMRTGGLGSAVAETLKDRGLEVPLVRLGIPDQVIPHGKPEAQHEALGLGPSGIRKALRELEVVAEAQLLEASD